MKKQWQEIWTAVMLGVLIPGLMLRTALLLMPPKELPFAGETSQTQAAVPEQRILVHFGEDEVREMDLEEYLVGVLLGEMPASFSGEAQKAQAVVARTYTLRTSQSGKHPGGGVCTSPGCCQAYVSPEDSRSEEIAVARRAVEETAGWVLMYQGELIDATYFSCSGGYTEDAVAVWGTDVPYLQAVPSPGEEYAAHYTDEAFFSREELSEALGTSLSGESEDWVGRITYTQGGGVAAIELGGAVYSGTELRRILGLRSTAFTITAEENGLRIQTRGFGHRVGMSQYGADAMAREGKTWQEILTYYYTGVTPAVPPTVSG